MYLKNIYKFMRTKHSLKFKYGGMTSMTLQFIGESFMQLHRLFMNETVKLNNLWFA